MGFENCSRKIDGIDSLEILYGLSSKYGSTTPERFETYKGRIPADWIPIGEAPGGNQVCLSIHPSGARSVEFRDQESEVGPGLPPRGTGLTKTTDTLQAFVSQLTSEDPPEHAPLCTQSCSRVQFC